MEIRFSMTRRLAWVGAISLLLLMGLLFFLGVQIGRQWPPAIAPAPRASGGPVGMALPTVPTLPAVPTLPTLPTVPTLPTLPAAPAVPVPAGAAPPR